MTPTCHSTWRPATRGSQKSPPQSPPKRYVPTSKPTIKCKSPPLSPPKGMSPPLNLPKRYIPIFKPTNKSTLKPTKKVRPHLKPDKKVRSHPKTCQKVRPHPQTCQKGMSPSLSPSIYQPQNPPKRYVPTLKPAKKYLSIKRIPTLVNK